MSAQMTAELALNALLMAVWRRKPGGEVLVYSNQGSQFSSQDWQSFLHTHKLKESMSRRGNCHDNAVAEGFSNCSSASGSRGRSMLSAKNLAGMC